jgi:uncharacterized membrane protein YhhN
LRIYNKYIVSLAVAAGLINTLLAFAGQNNLEIYFTVNIIAFLAITLLYVYLNPRARKALNTIGVVLFAGFMIIVVFNVVKMLSGR